MANTISNDQKNSLISQSALEQFTKILAPVNAFSTSFNDDASDRGDQVNILNIANTSTADDFDVDDGYKSSNTTFGNTQIQLNKHKFVTWHVTDKERSNSSAVELERFGYQKGGDLANAVFQDILSSVKTSAFSAEVAVGSGDFGVDDVASLRQKAVTNSLPIDNTSLLLSPAYYGALIQDSAVASALAYGGNDAIRGGNVPSLFGIPAVYESNSIPSNNPTAGGTDENLVGLLAHPCGLAVAMRYLEPANTQEYISAKRVSDDETGMVMGYREFYDPQKGIHTAVLECVYGYAVGRAEGIVRLVSE